MKTEKNTATTGNSDDQDFIHCEKCKVNFVLDGDSCPYCGEKNVSVLFNSCKFIQHCHANADTISYAEWIAMVTNVARCQSGLEMIHKLSILRPMYSLDETNAKIKHALNNMNPATCLHIKHSLNFNNCPPNGCGVKAPCGLALSKSLLTNI